MPAAAAPPVKKRHIGKLKLSEDISFQPPDRMEMNVLMEDGVGVVEDVKILGYSSRNKNRRYLPDGIKPEMYEGKEVYIDHPDPEDQKKPRKLQDKIGWLEGVYKTKAGLFAKKFKFNPEHTAAKDFQFWATQNPRQIGFSQNAFGDVYEAQDGELVEEVTEVRSIDLVADPATTKGLYEAYADTEGGEGHTGYEGEPCKSSTDTRADKHKLAAGSPGPSSVVPEEKLVLEDENITEDDEEETPGDEDQEMAAEDADPGVGGDVDSEQVAPAPVMADEEDEIGAGAGAGMDVDISPELSSAAQKIFDSGLDMKTKLKRLVHLLKLKHADLEECVQVACGLLLKRITSLEEAVKIADFPTAKKVAAKLSRKYKLNSVKKLLEWIDTREVADAIAAKEASLNKLLSAARLPEEVVTAGFREELLECKSDRAMQNKIDDRRRLVEVVTGRVQKSKVRPKSAAGAVEPELLEGIRRDAKPKKVSKEEQEKNLQAFEDEIFAGVSFGGEE